jgi:hypothetical protein
MVELSNFLKTSGEDTVTSPRIQEVDWEKILNSVELAGRNTVKNELYKQILGKGILTSNRQGNYGVLFADQVVNPLIDNKSVWFTHRADAQNYRNALNERVTEDQYFLFQNL